MTHERRIKLYTKTGDKGHTSLYDGSRASKTDRIFDVLGTMDELNCHIGLLTTIMTVFGVDEEKSAFDRWNLNGQKKSVSKILRMIQYKITHINSIIATPKQNKPLPGISDTDITILEKQIDLLQQQAPPLREFVLPGSTPGNAQAHVCRVITRKAERIILDLFWSKIYSDIPDDKKRILIWINRLSDYFFALARVLANFSPEPTMSEMEHEMEDTYRDET